MALNNIEWLNKLPQWSGKESFGLDVVSECYKRLHFPCRAYKTIHVAGTNGKGSVSCLVAAALGSLGYKVGLYTSPHLVHINERVVVDGSEVSAIEIDRACEEIRALGSISDKLTAFEAHTLAAFLSFKNQAVDYAVVEVGLGGRLDSTNVIESPACAVITTIDFDHEMFLGNTQSLIAKEKAGIIKCGSPLVVGNVSDEAKLSISEVALRLNVIPQCYGSEYSIDRTNRIVRYSELSVGLDSSLAGEHQLENVAVAAVAVISALKHSGIEISNQQQVELIERGFQTVYWPNRLERIVWRDKSVIIDSAHNPAGIRTLISFLDKLSIVPTVVLFGVVDTKRWDLMIEELSRVRPTAAMIVPPQFITRDIRHKLVDKFQENRINTICYDSIQEAVSALSLRPEPRVVCCGSMYMTGPLRTMLEIPMRQRWIRRA